MVTAKVYYSGHTVKRVDEIKQKMIPFQSQEKYLHYVVTHVKDTIMKFVCNLRNTTIVVKAFDTTNVFHHMIVTVSSMIGDLLKQKIDLSKSIFIYVYEDAIKFMGAFAYE
jgi:hypothetical protein